MLTQILKARRIGYVFTAAAVTLSIYISVRFDRCAVAVKPLMTVPAFATPALSSLGLISLFVGILYQRRFQRGDELIREVSVLREILHPDYREQMGLAGDYTHQEKGLDPRYEDKHKRTVEMVRRFREYRQLFLGVPPYNVAFALVYYLTTCAALLLWVFSMSAKGWWEIVLHAVALAVTAESLSLVGRTLWQISWFPHRGEDLTMEAQLGLPGWYKLLDVNYLRQRFLPFAPFVAALECYLMLSRRRDNGRDEWVLSLQLPLPVREWEYQCTVTSGGRPICRQDWKRVSLTPTEADLFFARPGLWMQTEVAAWPADRTAASEFDGVVITLTLHGADDQDVLTLVAPQPGSSWYQGERIQGPMRYPWFSIRFVQREPVLIGDGRTLLFRPPSGGPADQSGGTP